MVIVLSTVATLALSVMVLPVCTSLVIGVIVSVGSDVVIVISVFSLVSFLHCVEPLYTACIVEPSFAHSLGIM